MWSAKRRLLTKLYSDSELWVGWKQFCDTASKTKKKKESEKNMELKKMLEGIPLDNWD